MIYRHYGGLSKPVSLIGLGTLRFSSDPAGFGKNTAIVEKALELGINYFDTCSEYACGSSEAALGAVLHRADRESLVITAKSRLSIDPTAEDVLRRVDSDLKVLHMEYIDLFHMWCIMNLEEYRQITAPGGPYEGAVRAKEQGLISHICCSVHCSGQELEKIISDGLFDGVILGFNAMNYRYRLSGLQAAKAKNMGIAIMNPLAGGMIPRQPEYFGHLKGKDGNVATGAIQFLAAHEEISTILIGASIPEDLTSAAYSVDIPQEYSKADWYARIDSQPRLSESLCTMCGYCAGCPAGVPIKELMASYNAYLLSNCDEAGFHYERKQTYDQYPFEKAPCMRCGACERKCTQHLPIMRRLAEINQMCDQKLKQCRQIYEQYFSHTEYPNTAVYGLSAQAEIMLRTIDVICGGLPDRVWVFDSSPNKWGMRVVGTNYFVHSPNELKELQIGRVFITAAKFEKEIRLFLQDYVFPDTEIAVLR